ncbi:MAG TPA: tetratricopeptide repeat-containing protein [Treponemataceae bacterium]|nr:tetratricopeptide repeat-containing protein [Treponemataceae bacterium]
MLKNTFSTWFLLFILLFSVSCSSGSSNYLTDGLREKTEEQKELLILLEKKTNSQETHFALMNNIAANLLAEKNNSALIVFLTSSVENDPDNPYNAYWLLMVAHTYLQDEAFEIAEYFLNRILENYPDLEIQGKSIHLMSLENLIKITESPEMQIKYYSELITRFGPEIDLGYSYFMLARSYEKLGEWQLAIQTYMQFLSYGRFDIVIPGIPDSYEYAKKLVDYNTSSKDWIFETLDELVQSITKAISIYDYRSLEKYRAKVNFFAMSWKQESSDTNSQADFQMRDFMGGNRVRFSETLDSSSNPYEAYLRTSGWSQYVSVWYLYFRKINFPADPDIHGCWEWAGIYYGEKL